MLIGGDRDAMRVTVTKVVLIGLALGAGSSNEPKPPVINPTAWPNM
jgi:hypothetical protein